MDICASQLTTYFLLKRYRRHTDYIVFSMYRKNHNQCSGKKMGTYRTDIGSFIKAYVRHMEKMKNMYGIEYEEPDDDALMYLNCQAAYNNNRLVSLSSEA